MRWASGFHGHLGPFLVLGLRAGLIGVRYLGRDIHGLRALVETAASPPRSCFIDGVQFSSGCTLGKGNIEVRPGGNVSVTFQRGRRRIRVSVLDTVLQSLAKMTTNRQVETLAKEILHKTDEELFDVKIEEMNSKSSVITNIEKAVRIIEVSAECANILPEVGSNIAMALPNAKNLTDIAGLTGRIIRVENKAVGVGRPEFGATKHMGTVLLSSMRYNPKFRAAINLKYTPELVQTCKELGMDVGTYDHEEKSKEAAEIKCNIPFIINRLNRVSEVVYDLGDVGIEASTVVFGRTAVEVARKATRIAKRYHNSYALDEDE
ncbi:MAG: thiamine-phosphate synthase family protein [Candidatus Bathyarchaeia archaeon]